MHHFQVPATVRQPICPDCGCRFVRLAGRHGSQLDVVDANLGEQQRLEVTREAGRHRVGGDTWLSDKRKFAELAMTREPGMSPAELARHVRAWFGGE